ncbi:hypothetical protein [Lysinibacillus sp. NPDC056185]|uniref:hypothetical protein n=1 Tax=Lysinibacillus sp. NPDC056185 TaxID=3345739 RepID=UPI0039EE336D
MKKVLILIIAISLFVVLSKTKAMINEYEEITKSNKADITLCVKKMNEAYTDFKIFFKGGVLTRPYWINTTSPTWLPQIIYEDINKDGKNELIIILTKGTGTGILEREVHVFHIQNQRIKNELVEVPVEVLVDNPIAIVLKNVKTELSPNKAIISIGEKKFTINVKPLKIEPEHLFPDIYFGNLINFEINDNQLIAKIGGQISPAGGSIGDIQITYMFKDIMYQAKSIEFNPNE